MKRITPFFAVLAFAGCVGVGDERHSLSRPQSDQAASEPTRHSWLYNRLSQFWGGKSTPSQAKAAERMEMKTAQAPKVELTVEPVDDLAARPTADPEAQRTRAEKAAEMGRTDSGGFLLLEQHP